MTQRLQDWIAWLTDDRLARLNHLRYRSGAPDLSREDAARLIMRMTEEERHWLKKRIAE